MPLYCPYCLAQQAFNRPLCVTCNKAVSRDYIQNARQYAPVWLVTFGYPGHGKTSAVSAMSVHIEHIDKIADGAMYDYLDDQTWEIMDSIRLSDREVEVDLAPTRQTESPPDPMLISLDGFPGTHPNTLVIYDLAGEAAVTPHDDYVRVVQNAQVAWFVVSLNDLSGVTSRDDTQPRTINGLFMRYRKKMEDFNVPLRGRTVLVNYTKADLFIKPDNPIQLPERIRDYFVDDPYFQLTTTQADTVEPFIEADYRRTLEEISDDLREFTRRHVPGGRAFIDQAEKRYGMNVVFCISSSTGGSEGDTEIKRYRVLDPLLWAIYLNDSNTAQTINAALIVDPALYKVEYPTLVYNILAEYGANVTTYHVGEKRPVFEAGQVPSSRTGKAQLDLIGPILDVLDAGGGQERNMVLLLLDQKTPFDLYDFRNTHWELNLHVITSHPDTANGWSNRSVLDSPDDDLGFILAGVLENWGKRG